MFDSTKTIRSLLHNPLLIIVIQSLLSSSAFFIQPPFQVGYYQSSPNKELTLRQSSILLSNSPYSESEMMDYKDLFRVRTVTCFLGLSANDFANNDFVSSKIKKAATLVKKVQKILVDDGGYEVQTLRIATNPFGEWLYHKKEIDSNEEEEEIDENREDDDGTRRSIHCATAEERLKLLNTILKENDIHFCSLGPARNANEITTYCPMIVSHGLSCSAIVDSGDVESARAAASVIKKVTWEQNFRFCAASSCQPFIPFFPAAKSQDSNDFTFALGLENGPLIHHLFSSQKVSSLATISTVFKEEMTRALLPLHQLCSSHFPEDENNVYKGIDTSLNPSLDGLNGSIAYALEQLPEIKIFGQSGTLAAAAAITQALQSLPGIKRTGYCGLMLPVCEDIRLAQLASSSSTSSSSSQQHKQLTVTQLLNISSVCGVGVDTVPLAGDVSIETLTALILDVAALAGRWDKSLSCRVFPVENAKAGEFTPFDDSPYMCNSEIFDLQ